MCISFPDINNQHAVIGFVQQLAEVTTRDKGVWKKANPGGLVACRNNFLQSVEGNIFCLVVDVCNLYLIHSEEEGTQLVAVDNSGELVYSFPHVNQVDDIYKVVHEKYEQEDKSVFYRDLFDVRDSLYEYALKLTNDNERAKDLVMETTYQILKNESRIYKGKMYAYAHVCLRHLFLNDNNRMIRRDSILDSNGNIPEDTAVFTESDIENSYTIQEVMERIKMLDEEYRTPLNMKLEGYKTSEIAEELNLPIEVISVRIQKARRLLRKWFK